jgi:branched-subunit amino acid aminotransferase/4-amino-4-deoxychorismate lyase
LSAGNHTAIGNQLAPKAGLCVEEKQTKAEDAAKADELFIAVSSKDVVPVVKFNEG